MRLALVAGTTATAGVDGSSAAGADPELMWHTPSADLDILVPGGTTPALGVLTAIGEPATVSSSLPETPLAEREATAP